MKIRYFISFNEGRAAYERTHSLLKEVGCLDGLLPRENILAGYYQDTFSNDDPRLTALRAILLREGIKWSERKEYVYADTELRQCELLSIGLGAKPLECGGPVYGTQYDLSTGCPRCGCGAKQVGPLLLPLKGLPKKALVCSAGHGELLISESLVEPLRAAKLTGLELRQARFYRNNDPLPWWQLISDYCMPSMSPKTRGIILDTEDHVVRPDFSIRAMPPCPQCHRDGRYHTNKEPCEIMYSRKDIDPGSIPDFVHTWESFGKSGIDHNEPRYGRYYDPMTLVKPRILELFRSLKVRHVGFSPVQFVD